MPEHKTKSQLNDALCAPYEPLRPPEYKRNELGQFSRPGKNLAGTQKKTGLSKELIKKLNDSAENQLPKPAREPDGRYKNGGARPGAGRPKGSANKISQSLKEMILASLDELGGKEYLKTLGIENSSAYCSLIGKVLPTTLQASDSDGSASTQITFRRILVWPGNREEIEGVTPKALPSPDAACPTLPRPTDPTDDTNEGAV
jgi:hypothetical protein